MDKRKPNFKLSEVKELVNDNNSWAPTGTALRAADSLGFSRQEIADVIFSLERKDFYKSMTDYGNHALWQDVYKKRVRNIDLYLKFKVTTRQGKRVIILSFKQDESSTSCRGE